MPVASYRSTFGVSLDKNNTTLSAASAVGATTLNVNAITGTIGNLYTVTIIDGPLTEQVAASASTSSTITVGATANAHPAGTYITAQLTASLGPTDYMPVTVIDHTDSITQLADKGFRGSAVEQYGSKQGTRIGEFTIGGDVIVDTIGYMIGGVTGAIDFTGGTPNLHAFSMKNTGDTQPTPLVLWDFNAIDTRVYAGAKVSELTFHMDPKGLLTWQAKLVTFMGGPVAATTASFSAIGVSEAWRSAVQLGGAVVGYVDLADVTLRRSVAAVDTLTGSQDPYRIWSGAQGGGVRFHSVMEDNTQLNNYLNNSQPAIDLKWTASGANPAFLQIHFTGPNYDMAKVTQIGSLGYVELDVDATGNGNTTDKTTAGTGYAPFKVTLGNARSTGTFQ